jgi:hypothetical protein
MQVVNWLAVALSALLAGAATYSAIALIYHFLAWIGAPASPAMEACLYFQAALFGAGVAVYATYRIAPVRRITAANIMASVVTLIAMIEAVTAALNGALMDVPRAIGAMIGVLLALHVKAQEA